MMASPSELSLDCKPNTYSLLLKSFGDQTDQTQNLQDLLSRLEDERLKIDAFKRELPLCMQLLTNAVENSRQQLQAYRANNQGQRPVLEEFIPLKHSSSEGVERASNNIISHDKTTWMTSAQLWSQASDNNIHANNNNKQQYSTKETTDIGFNVSPKLALDNKQRIGGAFLPFSKERNSCPSPTLALAASADQKEMEDHNKCHEGENGISCSRRDNCGNIEQGKVAANNQTEAQPTTTAAAAAAQTHRKARRCWSPDLHRRFVNALQMLGGSQVATPKQIRELMKVDGLTNDEVKSHLQKYRLHTRRPSPSPQVPGATPPQLVVLGSIWVPPEYAAAAAATHGGAPTLYGAHPTSHAPPHYCAPPVPQDFYPSPQSHHHHHHHQLLQHHQLHVFNNKASSQTHSSPESDGRGAGGGGERSESIEDGKSESSSWKGDSGENNGGGERKGLAALRDECEESNGSEITLKF